ncbi:AAA family ATPase [Sphingomonas sp. 22176]|uniref:AAA family ATPase n=1 Tax=Sphingomonas sp. 22176 TaxID=3453884 RepID=UPI003F856AA0
MTRFTVFPPSKIAPSPFEGAALKQDNWNDFSYVTQYHLYLNTPAFTGQIGTVKILRRGQRADGAFHMGVGELPELGDDFVSLGQDLDYYERLATLPDGLRTEILSRLRDALTNTDHAATFYEEDGWKKSVLRYIDWPTFRRDALVLLDRDYDKVARLDVSLSFAVTGWHNALQLDFRAPNDPFMWGAGENMLPDRIAVLVGRNGSGKSTLLSRLARVIHASQRDRAGELLRSIGTIDPPGIGFTRVVNVAYSAFDAFQVPGVDASERRQIADETSRGIGRYHYCGLRDIAAELRSAEGIGDVDGDEITAEGPDRLARVIFKTSQQLSDEFASLVKRIWEIGRQDLFAEVCRILASDVSFQDLGEHPASTISNDPLGNFRKWSTGHKIALHLVASLVAFTEPKSIVLIDEPESHLHPPLLAALMHAVRAILRKNDAFAVVATHSPVVVQETLSRHVSIVRRSGDETWIFRPRIQTYGESIGEITNEVFGLTTDATDFHVTLANMVDRGMSLEIIESLFEGGLSMQARAFVMTKLASGRAS